MSAAAAKWLPRLVSLAIAGLAAGLRLRGIGFGLPAINDPDELMFELGALNMLKTASLDPGWFGHPAAITMHVLALINGAVFLIGHAAGRYADSAAFAAAVYDDPGLIVLPGRVAMALFSLGCVWAAGRFAARQWGLAAGWTAALVLAASPVFVAWSQVIRSDIVACLFMLLALLSARTLAGSGGRRALVLAALWTGCAIASKWPFALTMLAVAGALSLRPERKAALRALALYLALVPLFVVLVAPYLLLDWQTALRDIAGEAQVRHLGSAGSGPWGNALWYARGPLLGGLGAAGCALALAGLALIVRAPQDRALLIPLLIGFAVLLVSQSLVWERWALPLLVLLALAAGRAAGALAAWARGGPPLRHAAAPLVAAALAVPLAGQTWSQATARQNDTRQQASAWVRGNVPPGKRILVEHFGFDLLYGPWDFDFPLGALGCRDVRGLLDGGIGHAGIDHARGERTVVDYGTIPSAREATCQPDFAVLSNYDRYQAEKERFPQEYAMYQRLMARGRVVATFRPVAGTSAGPIVRIVAFGARQEP